MGFNEWDSEMAVHELKKWLWDPRQVNNLHEVVIETNNFHYYFRQSMRERASRILLGIRGKNEYIFKQFLEQNINLVERINNLTPLIDYLNILYSWHVYIYENEGKAEADKFRREKYIQSFELLLWDQLNPLMSKAVDKLVELWFSRDDLVN